LHFTQFGFLKFSFPSFTPGFHFSAKKNIIEEGKKEEPYQLLLMANLPPFAPFPSQAWRQHLSTQEWDTLADAWLALSTAWIGLPDSDFIKRCEKDESIAIFVSSATENAAVTGDLGSLSSSSSRSTSLLRAVYQLAGRLLRLSPPPELLTFDFLANFSKAFPKKHAAPVISSLFENHATAAETSLSSVKKLLIPHLDAGIRGDLKLVESHLIRLNHILHVSSHACILFLAGSDFFDGLVSCFKVMNPPLRKAIVTTAYLCLVGLTAAEPPKWAMLSDQLYGMKAAADMHKQGPTNANDSLVPEIITTTPILKLILRRAEASGAASENLKKRIDALEAYRKGPLVRPKRLVKRKVDKGKGKEADSDVQAEMHIHRMSQIAVIQDLFPDLGSGFVSKCLDEYGDDTEQVVANLLSETLPSHLSTADRTEQLCVYQAPCKGFVTRLLTVLDLPNQGHLTKISHRGLRLRCFPRDVTNLMMTSLIASQWIPPSSHLERSRARQPMRCCRTGRKRRTRPQSCPPWRPLTRTMTSATTRTTRPMSVAPWTQQTRRPTG
jgi:activating signal cointegrator complex subunit 2